MLFLRREAGFNWLFWICVFIFACDLRFCTNKRWFDVMFPQMTVPVSDRGNPTSLMSGCHTERSEVIVNTWSWGAQTHTKLHLDEMSVVARRWPTGPSALALLSSTEDTLTQETSSSASSRRTDPRYVEHLFSAAANADSLVSCPAFDWVWCIVDLWSPTVDKAWTNGEIRTWTWDVFSALIHTRNINSQGRHQLISITENANNSFLLASLYESGRNNKSSVMFSFQLCQQCKSNLVFRTYIVFLHMRTSRALRFLLLVCCHLALPFCQGSLTAA